MGRKSLCALIVIVLAILLSGALLEAANIGKDAKGRPTWDGNLFIPRWLYDSGAAEGLDPVQTDQWLQYFTAHGLDPLFNSKAINLYIHLTTGTYDNHIHLADHLAPRGIAAVAVGNQVGGATLPQYGIDNNHRYTIDPPYRRNVWEPHAGAGGVYLADEPEDSAINNVEEWYGYYKADSPTKPKINILLHGIRDKAVIEPWAQRQTGDWWGSDPYPVGIGANNTDWTNTNGWPNWWVAENTGQIVKMANLYGKVPIMVLQLNIFQGFTSDRGRFPTNDELWSHVVMAFAEGARGVGWWALGTQEYATDRSPSTAERQRMRDTLLRMGTFLRDHEAILVEDPTPSVITANSTHQADAKTWRLNWLNKVLSATFAGKTYDNHVWNGGMTDPLERERDRLNAGDLSWGWMLDQRGNVRTRTWLAADGTVYIFSYNHDIDAVTATLTLDRTISQVQVLGDEARTVPVNADGKSFTDTWGGSHSTRQGPFRQAHIYRITTGGPPPPPAPLTLTFTNPANGATVSGTITVSLAASGGTGSYTRYTVAVDGTPVFDGTTSAFSWNTTSVPNGAHTLTGTVTDSAGTIATASISVTVQQPPPGGSPLSVSITQPTTGTTVSGTNWVIVWSENAIGAVQYQLYIDNVATGPAQPQSSPQPTSIPWNTTTVANGSHTIKVTGTDGAGRTASSTVTVTVSNGPPLSVFITQPTSGTTVSGTNWVIVWSENAIGAVQYQLYIDNIATGPAQPQSSPQPTSIPWNTTAVSNGSHTIKVTGTDGAGRTASSTVTVTVSNGPPLAVFITQPTSGTTVSGTNWVVVWSENAIGAVQYTVTVAGRQVASQAQSSPQPTSIPWDTHLVPNGAQTITVTGTDGAGRTATSTVNVTVAN